MDDSPAVSGSYDLNYVVDPAHPEPVIVTTLASDPAGAVPTTLKAQLTWNGTAQGWVSFSTSGHSAGDVYDLALQPAAGSVITTGAYPWSMEVQATLPGGTTLDQTTKGIAYEVVGSGSALGAGWGLSGVDQLVSIGGGVNTVSGVLWVYGAGGWRFFPSLGGNRYLSPPDDFGTLVKNLDGSYTYTAKDQTKINFNSSGLITSRVDTHGLALTYTYSGGLLQTEQFPDGSTATFSYDGNSLLQTLQEPGNRTLTFTHSAAKDLVGITLPDGSLYTFTYNTAHQLTNEQLAPMSVTIGYDSTSGVVNSLDWGGGTTLSLQAANTQGLATSPAINRSQAVGVITDGLNQRTTFTYLTQTGQLTQLQTPDGASWSWKRDFAGQPTKVTDPLGHVTTMAYLYGPGKGDLTHLTNPDGSTLTFQYNSFHELTQVQDTRGNLWSATYDATTGDLLTEKDPLGHVTTFTWSNGLLQTMTDPRGYTTTFQWDGARRLLTDSVDPQGDRTTFTYDSAGDMIGVEDARGSWTTTSYDGMGRPLTVQDAAGGVATFAYNALGEETQSVDQLGHVTSYGYDEHGWLTTVTEAVGTPVQRTTTIGYDVLGRPTTLTDGNGHTVTATYDGGDRVRTVTNAVGAVETFSYDLAGERIADTDGLGHTATFTYNARGWMATSQDALGQTATYQYDTEGNLTGLIDPRGYRSTFTYDAADELTQTQNALGNLATIVYDAAGNVQATVDERGFRTTYSYDGLERLIQTQDPVGGLTTVIYDADGNVLATVDPRGDRTTFTYDSLDRPIQTEDALGDLATVVYDAASNVTATVNERGFRTTYSYDALDRLVQTQNALGGLATLVYDAADNVIASVDELGRRTTFSYDPADRLTQTQHPDGGLATLVYDAADNVTASVDPLGNRSTFTYDRANELLTAEDPTGAVSSYAYDAAGNLVSATDARGYTTTYSYNGLNQQTQTQDALGNLATVVYDAAGNVQATVDPRGYRTTFSYDGLNQLTSTSDALNHTSTLVYDSAGNVVQSIDPAGFTTTYSFDALNREVSVQDPAGGIATTVYDAAGNVVQSIDQLGQTTTYGYDGLDQLTQSIDPRGAITTTVYDAVGNTVNLIDADRNTTTFVYNSMDELTQQTDPLGHSATFAYDLAGRLASSTDRDGRQRFFRYDAAGRETGETWTASGSTQNLLTFTYDGDGNLLTAADYAGTYTMSYDGLDRTASQQEPFGQALTFSYDGDGNRTQRQDSQGGLLTYVYDAADRLTSLQETGQAPLRVDMSYTSRDQLASITRYSDLGGTATVVYTAYSFDNLGRLANLHYQNGSGGDLANFTYAYDSASRLTSETTNGATKTFTYDKSNEVTGDGTATYSYDATGNRTLTGYQTGPGNQLLNDGAYTYTYDAEGNLIQKSAGPAGDTWLYGYDDANHLVSVQHLPTNSVVTMVATYTYDAFGNRIEKDVWQGGVTTVTRYAYDGSDVWATLDGNNTLQTRYLRLPETDQLLARVTASGTVSWYVTDWEGSVRNLVDNNGTVQDTITYDAYGNVLSESNAAYGDQWKYTGGEYDAETGLYHFGARMYIASTGRWMEEDPLGFAGGDVNTYRYVANGPTLATDPSGQNLHLDNDPKLLRYVLIQVIRAGIPRDNLEVARMKDGTWIINLRNHDSATINRVLQNRPSDIDERWWRLVITHLSDSHGYFPSTRHRFWYVRISSDSSATLTEIPYEIGTYLSNRYHEHIEPGCSTGLVSPPFYEDPIFYLAGFGQWWVFSRVAMPLGPGRPKGRPLPGSGSAVEESDFTTVYHKGELIEGQVRGHRPFSTGTDRAAVEALNRPGTVHEFRIPKDVLARWKFEGRVQTLQDYDAITGTYNQELRFDPSLAQDLNGYMVK